MDDTKPIAHSIHQSKKGNLKGDLLITIVPKQSILPPWVLTTTLGIATMNSRQTKQAKETRNQRVFLHVCFQLSPFNSLI